MFNSELAATVLSGLPQALAMDIAATIVLDSAWDSLDGAVLPLNHSGGHLEGKGAGSRTR